MSGRRVKTNKKNRVLLKLFFLFYLGFCLFATVWLRATVVNLEYELGELDKLRTELTRDKKMMVAQRASFYSSERIEKVATKRLGMSQAEREKIFFIKRARAAGPYRTSINNN
jgi:cell division protein FtsL